MEVQVKQFKEVTITFSTAPLAVPMYILGKPDRAFMKIKLEGSHGASFMLVDVKTGVVIPENQHSGATFKLYKTHSLTLEL